MYFVECNSPPYKLPQASGLSLKLVLEVYVYIYSQSLREIAGFSVLKCLLQLALQDTLQQIEDLKP